MKWIVLTAALLAILSSSGCAMLGQDEPLDASEFDVIQSVLDAAGTNAPAVVEAAMGVWVAAGPNAPGVLAAALNYDGKPGDELAQSVLDAAGTNAPAVITAVLAVWDAAGPNTAAMLAAAAGGPVTITTEDVQAASEFLAAYGEFTLPVGPGAGSDTPPDPPSVPPATGTAGDVSSPGDVLGYGVVNGWMGIREPARFAKALRAAGCNATHIELMGWAETSAWGSEASIAARLARAKVFITAMRAEGITTFVNICNANVGSREARKYGDDGQWPLSRIPDAWFFTIVTYFRDEIGTDLIILQPLSEHSGAKARQWAGHALANWPGRISWNEGSRPGSHPAGYWCHEYHPSSVGDVGRGGDCIVTTDTSAILSQLGSWSGDAKPDVLRAYVERVRAASRGFLHYDFGRRGGWDHGAVEAIGKAR